MESLGDYFDLEMAEDMPTAEIAARLEEQMAEGMHIVSVRKVEDGKAGKAMALVAAADYLVEFRPGKKPCERISGTAGDQSDQADQAQRKGDRSSSEYL